MGFNSSFKGLISEQTRTKFKGVQHCSFNYVVASGRDKKGNSSDLV